MIHIEPKEMTVPQVHAYLLSGVAPRPIALVSTLSSDGKRNLSPFSFFNAFGANPPTVAFSPARRGRDGTLKDTYNNLMATKECTIQAVTHSIMHQVNLASAEWPSEVDEFEKSGLTPVASDIVRPPRVAESPFQMECKLTQMVHLGESKASGNLAICEVVKFHIAEELLEGNIIHPARIGHVARNGGAWWSRVTAENLFQLPKPPATPLIGYDGLPASIKQSHLLSANNLAQLGNYQTIPGEDEIASLPKPESGVEYSATLFERMEREGQYEAMWKLACAAMTAGASALESLFHRTARVALDQRDDREFAWKVLGYWLNRSAQN